MILILLCYIVRTRQKLCRANPEKAFTTTEKFGTSLRQNIDSLSQPNLIPLQKELEHTRIYAEIEHIRFLSVTVEYDIQNDGFSIPALSIQPLVENAIRHGTHIGIRNVRERVEKMCGGTVQG